MNGDTEKVLKAMAKRRRKLKQWLANPKLLPPPVKPLKDRGKYFL